MCGRKTLNKSSQMIVSDLMIDKWEYQNYKPSYNISPGQDSPVLILLNNSKIVKKMNWGLIPSQPKYKSRSRRMINARYETILEKPSFKDLFSSNRCIVLADGYYEWSTHQNSKIPHYIHSTNNSLLPMAGLWSKSQDRKKNLYTYTIITTVARNEIYHIHKRMPVILKKNSINNWLYNDKKNNSVIDISDFYNEKLEFFPVSTYVNSVKNDSPQCIKKLNGVDNLNLFSNKI